MAYRWYVVHVYSGFEKKVAQAIEEQAKQMGMEDQIDQVLVPTEEVVEMRRGAHGGGASAYVRVVAALGALLQVRRYTKTPCLHDSVHCLLRTFFIPS